MASSMLSLLHSLESQNKDINSGFGTWGHRKAPNIIIKARGNSQAAQAEQVAKSLNATTHKSSGGGLLDDITGIGGNLLQDIKDTAKAAPGGIEKLLTTNPVDTAKAIGADYKKRYGMLLDGKFSEFAHEVALHPLAPLLDATTVLTGGAGAVGKVGQLSKVADAAASGSRAAKILNEMGAAGKIAELDFAGGKVPVNLSRNAFTRMKQRALVATQNKLPNLPVVGGASRSRSIIEHRIHDKAIQDVTEHLGAALKATDHLESLIKKHPHLEQAIDSNLRGISPHTESKFLGDLSPEALKSQATQDMYHSIRSQVEDVTTSMGEITGKVKLRDGVKGDEFANAYIEYRNTHVDLGKTQARILGLDENIQADRAILHKKIMDEAAGRGERSAEQMQRDLRNVGGHSATYTPDVKFVEGEMHDASKQDLGILFKSGTREVDLRRMTDIQGGLIKKYAREQATPDVLKSMGLQAASTITKGTSALEKNVESIKIPGRIKDDAIVPESKAVTEEALTEQEQHIATVNGQKFNVDKKLMQSLEQRYSPKEAGTIAHSWDKATQIWKDIVLAGRPAFLINNFVGNQGIYHLKHGLGGIAFTHAISGKIDSAMDRFFPEQHMSFGSTERGAGNSKYRNTVNKIYAAQSKHEVVLRKATMYRAALSYPEIKTAYQAGLHRGLGVSNSLHKAIDGALSGPKGDLIRQEISRVVDDTMGNYRHFNQFELGLKRLVPFYSWNRHSLRVYTTMMRDNPAMLDTIVNLGEQGHKDVKDLPDFMQGLITVGGKQFDTNSINPLAAGSDDMQALKELVSGDAGKLPTVAQNLNPLAVGIAQSLFGRNITTGKSISRGGGLLGGTAEGITTALPQVKIASMALGMDKPNKRDPHTYLTPTGQVKREFKDDNGKVHFGKDGLPISVSSGKISHPDIQTSLLNLAGLPERHWDLKAGKDLKKSLLSPSGDFHSRKPSKKKYKVKIIR